MTRTTATPLWRRYLWTRELGAEKPRPAHNDNDGEPRNENGARLTGKERIRAKRLMAREGHRT